MNVVVFADFEVLQELLNVRLGIVQSGVGIRKLDIGCGRRPDRIPTGRRAAPRGPVVYIMVRNILTREDWWCMEEAFSFTRS